jgi:hypothetical protein
MKNHLQRFLMAGFLAVVSIQQGLHGQESPLEKAMLYPPGSFNKGMSEIQRAVIDWKLVQLEDRADQFLAQQELIEEQQKQMRVRVEEAAEQISAEQRIINSQVRSELAGSVLSDLIRVRLDAVASEAAIAELEVRAEKVKSRTRKTEAIDVKAAKLEFDLAKKSFERIKILFDRGEVPTKDHDQAEFELKIAELKSEKAVIEFKNAAVEVGAEISERLVDHRIELRAAKSRIAAAEEMLVTLATAEAGMAKLKHIQRELEELQKSGRQVAAQRAQTLQQFRQLTGLKRLIKERSAAKAAEKESEK